MKRAVELNKTTDFIVGIIRDKQNIQQGSSRDILVQK